MKLDNDARYTKEHEWIRKEGKLFVFGISDHAQDQLSDIVYLESPEVGDSFAQGDSFGVVESVKAASDLYMPMGGEIVEVNDALVDAPEIMNNDPYGEAWIIKFKASDPVEFDQLMSPEDYGKFIQEEE
jgi:glycine cleavage system H protein